jgi:IclR helix-turn-helix domain
MTTTKPAKSGFIMLPHAVYDSPEFESLKPIDIAVLLLMMRKYNGYNNGDIQLGVREVAHRCHCSLATASRALKSLQHAGFITLTYNGHLVRDFGRPNAPSRWKLNIDDSTDKRDGSNVIRLKPLPK